MRIQAEQEHDSGPATVLVIDDDDINRYVVTSWLRRAGHTVIDAVDGTQGLALLHAGAEPRPEVAIIDVRLPDMSGFEVCERIKGDPDTAALPVIHVSAAAITPEDHAHGLHRGADAYLNQPINPEELLATVTAALRYARARLRAERLAERLTTLNRATLEVYRAIGFYSFASAAVGGTAKLLSAPVTALFVTPQGQTVCSTTAGPESPVTSLPADGEVLARLTSQHLGSGTGSDIASVPRHRWNSVLPANHHNEDMTLVSARTKRGRPPVCLAVPATAVRTDDDQVLFQQLAHACALSLEALRTYSEEHSLALTLQRTFLPDRLPTVPGVELAFRYLPASEHTEIGGDFYEAIETDDGLLIAIGDIAGHSLAAATVMGEVRQALRAYALEGHPPHHIHERLEIFLARTRPGLTLTLCLILIEPGRRTIRVSNAGHIPPLVLAPDGNAEFVHRHGPLLGLGLPHPPSVALRTAVGTRIVLITDGLIETRTTHLDDSLDQFRTAAAGGPTELDALCDALLLAFGQDKEDDIALLTAHLS